MRVLAPDLGFRCGFGVRGGRNYVRSGSHAIKGSAKEMGVAFLALETLIQRLVDDHKPDVIGAAIPFIGRLTSQPAWNPRSSIRITPDTIRVVYGLECKLQEIADKLGIPYERVNEQEARKALTGYGGGKSEEQKQRTQDACMQRGWVFCDGHAADGLCIADFIYNKLNPIEAHRSSPLFMSAGLARARARKEAV